MKKILPLLAILLVLSSCATRMDINNAREQGADQLNTSAIKKLVAGNTLFMESWDKSEKADVEFSEKGGKLLVANKLGGKASGRWRASDNKLCIEFKWWGNDTGMECSSVHKLKDRYLLFKGDGTLTMTFVPEYEVEYTKSDANIGVMGGIPKEWSTKKEIKVQKEVASAPPIAYPSTSSSSGAFAIIPGAAASTNSRAAFTPQVAGTEEKLSSHHKLFLETGECPSCDLAGLDFSHTSLKGVNLQGADLSGAKFEESNLKGADLQGANLQGAVFADADLSKANLQDANLNDANLHWADLSKADLRNATLQRAYIVKTIFYKADLRGADFTDVVSQRTIFNKAKGVPYELVQKNAPWSKK